MTEAEKYWTEVLGMAEPKYCANNSWQFFLKGWAARGERIESVLNNVFSDKRMVAVALEALASPSDDSHRCKHDVHGKDCRECYPTIRETQNECAFKPCTKWFKCDNHAGGSQHVNAASIQQVPSRSESASEWRKHTCPKHGWRNLGEVECPECTSKESNI